MTDRTDYLWDPRQEPDPQVVRLERALEGFRFDGRIPSQQPSVRRRRVWRWVLAAAATAVAVIGAGAAYWRLSLPSPWTVEALTGAPRITRAGVASDRVSIGDRVETDRTSTARIAVGRVGVADVAPGSSVSIVRTDDNQHRLSLAHGTLHMSIWARPRFFVVDTPAATAIDLGCVYTLRVDSTGAGLLAVTVGEVELASGDRTALITAGTAVRMDRAGVGLPFPINATESFKKAVRDVEVTTPSDSTVGELLSGADTQGTITLWHLMSRVDGAQRARIVDRLDALVPMPKGLDRSAILALDSVSRLEWLAVLRPHWNSEPRSRLRRLLVRIGLVKPVMQLAVRRFVSNP